MNQEALTRVSNVIQTEATTPSIGDFLLTHLPFENLYLNNRKSISENDLLKNILLKNHDEHKFIMVQGGNGSGKSHLIRWLKEKYSNHIDPEKEAVLLISRAHNTLQDALTQLLESDIFPDEIKENELKHIKNAKSNITGEELNKTICFNFTLEIDADNAKQNDILDLRIRKWLSTYLKDNYIQSEFLLAETGPIERIRAKIETTKKNAVNHSEAPMFSPDDFNITLQQIRQKLTIADGRAADFTIKLAEKFADVRHGAILRQKVADYLNTKVSNVVQRSMKLQTADFKKLFSSLRKSLKDEGINLTLFVEDINSFTGIDEALMEVLLTDHSAEGNHEYCRIISVVGSTNAFYNDKLNASIKERIKSNIYIQEGSVLGTQEQLSKFAAKYINAINLSETEITSWVNSGAVDEDMPIYHSDVEWANVNCNGSVLSIFPFNDNALWKLYNTLSSDKKTPRVFLKSIIAHVLKLWFSNSEMLLSNENHFLNADISMPRWENQLYNQTNINIDENAAVQRGILLKVWGNGTAKYEPGLLGGLTVAVFDAFNVYSNISGTVSENNQKKSANNPIIATVTEQTPPAKTTSSVYVPAQPVPPQEQLVNKPQKLMDLEDDLLNWLYPKDPNKNKLNSHIELRDLLYTFIVSSIDWEAEGVPMSLVNAYINTKGRVHIEGQSISIGEGVYLKRNEETYYLLAALINYKHLGNNSWDFEGCSDHLVFATAWIERHREEIIQSIIAPKGMFGKWDIPLWNVASIYCIKTLFGGVDISRSSEDLAVELLGHPPDYGDESEHSQSWQELQKLVTKNVNYKQNIYNETLSYFSKSVGSAGAGTTKYIFVDALEIIKQIRKLKSMQWDISDMCPKEIDDYNSLLYYSPNFINAFSSKIERVIQDENEKATRYIEFFNNVFDNDFSEEAVTLSIQAIKDFLRFLTNELNISYVEDDYKAIKPSKTNAKLISSLSKVQKILEISSPPELLMRISKNPFEDIQKFYDCLISFNNLLNEKEKLFNSYVDIESKNAIDDYKKDISSGLDNMLNTLRIGGDTVNDD